MLNKPDKLLLLSIPSVIIANSPKSVAKYTTRDYMMQFTFINTILYHCTRISLFCKGNEIHQDNSNPCHGGNKSINLNTSQPNAKSCNIYRENIDTKGSQIFLQVLASLRCLFYGIFIGILALFVYESLCINGGGCQVFTCPA